VALRGRTKLSQETTCERQVFKHALSFVQPCNPREVIQLLIYFTAFCPQVTEVTGRTTPDKPYRAVKGTCPKQFYYGWLICKNFGKGIQMIRGYTRDVSKHRNWYKHRLCLFVVKAKMVSPACGWIPLTLRETA